MSSQHLETTEDSTAVSLDISQALLIKSRFFSHSGTMVSIKIKWNKISYDDVIIDLDKGVAALKNKVYELTGVPSDRQKLMAKGAWLGTLKDDAGWLILHLIYQKYHREFDKK